MKKKKKSLYAVIALIVVALIGGTIAYFTSSVNFENIFNTATYKTVTTEVFESPDNWTPGEEIPKTITTKNEGSIPVAVRVSYVEKWEDEDGVDITSTMPEDAVIINLDNINDWTENNGYYYYNYELEPDEETTSFMKSVTLNEEVGEVVCRITGENEKTCEATSDVLGKTYKLTITTETVQYDKYTEVWNTDIEIEEKPVVLTWDKYYYYDSSADNTTGETTELGSWRGYAIEDTTNNIKQVCGVFSGGTVCFNKDSLDIENNKVVVDGTKTLALKKQFEDAGASCNLSTSNLYCNDDVAECIAHNYGIFYCGDYNTAEGCKVDSNDTVACSW